MRGDRRECRVWKGGKREDCGRPSVATWFAFSLKLRRATKGLHKAVTPFSPLERKDLLGF